MSKWYTVCIDWYDDTCLNNIHHLQKTGKFNECIKYFIGCRIIYGSPFKIVFAKERTAKKNEILSFRDS